MSKYLIPIHEDEIIVDEMLGFITGGSVASTNDCADNKCNVHSGNCRIKNECQTNSSDCGTNICIIHRDKVLPTEPGEPDPVNPGPNN